ncbi:hypothetical protein ACTMS2_03910 [Micromonospora sp. SD12]|uniref:hypothetical protein n=1 Tax=Micromonospora sp. SD12 TaxID=3452216 RepID=UPI003F8B4E43
MKNFRALLVTGLVAGVAVAGGMTLVSGAASAALEDAPPSIEEDFSYPGAAQIEASDGIKLIKGDGKIIFAECVTGATNQIIVRSYAKLSGYCFTVKGAPGYLTLEISDVYQIRGDSHTASARVSVDGETQTVALPKNGWVGVGVGEDDTLPPAVLLELRVTG